MRTSILKPGYLVSLKTSIRGGISYQRVDIEREHEEEGKSVAKWETRREIRDPQEFQAATSVRGKVRTTVSSVCCNSAFGLLCPAERESDLYAAVKLAREIADEHNAAASYTQVECYVLVGKIAQTDGEASKAIASELNELMDAMQQGIAKADPSAIREAAAKARALGGMLDDDVSTKVNSAIAEARKAARALVARVEKAGEVAADVVAELSVQAIKAARFSFLDMDEGEVQAERPAARGLDLAPASGQNPVGGRSLPFELEV